MKLSLQPSYFDDVYRANADPWSFETSAYEAAKYARTIEALGSRTFERGFEIGCSIGVLTERLAARCARLLSVDVSEAALASARARCAKWPAVEFRSMQVPDQFPQGRFDLVVMSEVGYYWSEADLEKALHLIVDSLAPGGMLLMVHWTPVVADYPGTGDSVHSAAMAQAIPGAALVHLGGSRAEGYRIDRFERAGVASLSQRTVTSS